MITKEKIINYIREEYGCEPEYLWEKFPEYAIFRQRENRKWFAVVIAINRNQLGLQDEGKVDVLNVKGDPAINGSLRMTEGVFPGYHMNKQHWLSILLDGTVSIQLVKELIEMSFLNTKNKNKQNHKQKSL